MPGERWRDGARTATSAIGILIVTVPFVWTDDPQGPSGSSLAFAGALILVAIASFALPLRACTNG